MNTRVKSDTYMSNAVRNKLSTIGFQEAFGLFLLLIIVLLAVDLLRQLVVGQLALGRFGTLVWNGLIDSLYIALAAVGLSMTYSILRFANFSHGDLMTVGAFSGWTVAYLIGGFGIAELGSRLLLRADGGAQAGQLGMDIVASPVAIFIGLIASAVLTAIIAVGIDRLVYKRMRTADSITLLIASVGVALALRYIIAVVYTQETRGVVASAPTYELPGWMPIASVNLHEVTLVGLGVLAIVGIHLLLQYTKLGKSMRAMSDNRDLALVTGIPTERIITVTWLLGGGLAGMAGYLIVLNRSQITINLGWFLLLLIFAAVILGGIGSIYGALAGSLIIGMTINVSLIWISSDLNQIAAFTLMILVLIFKPTGLLGGVETA